MLATDLSTRVWGFSAIMWRIDDLAAETKIVPGTGSPDNLTSRTPPASVFSLVIGPLLDTMDMENLKQIGLLITVSRVLMIDFTW